MPRLLAFTTGSGSDFDIWVIREDGTDRRQLTSSSDVDRDPRFDETGTMVYFTRIEAGTHRSDVWRALADGTAEERVTDRGNFTLIDLHPTAGIIVRAGGGGIRAVDLDGENETQITHPPSGQRDGGPLWSPDGTEVSFTRRLSPTEQDLWVASADGSNARMVADSVVDTRRHAWHPIGDRLAAVLVPGMTGFDGDLFEIQADGSGTRRLTSTGRGGDPAWSPDGSRFAFRDGTVIDFRIIVMNADGSNPVTIDGGHIPRWSPDGTRLAYCRQAEESNVGIAVSDADGSEVRLVEENGDQCEVGGFDWHP